MRRSAFTLVELLVAIAIIGILASLALAGMFRADSAAKRTNTKTTVAKVSVQISEIWESYRSRKLPIDPKQVLSSNGNFPYAVQYANALGWLQYFQQIRGNPPYNIPSINPLTGQPYLFPYNTAAGPNNLQIATIRLAAIRELIRLEMPCRYLDFTDDPAAINAGNNTVPPVTALLIPQPRNAVSGLLLANPGGLSEQYRQFFISHYNYSSVPYDPKTSTYEPAECLYMIIKFASQNDLGQKSITDDPRLVGDADGDGMPEIQDAFLESTYTPAPIGSPYTRHNRPISFVRWPLGFISDLQPGPTNTQTQADYAAARHDINDPLRIDPRALVMTPLVYSGAGDESYGIWELSDYSQVPAAYQSWIPCIKNDPYYFSLPGFPMPGSQMDVGTIWPNGLIGTGAYSDNITSHGVDTGN